MADTTKSPWFVWETEYPEEGSTVFDAESEADAKALYAMATGTVDEMDETWLTAKRVTAEDVEKLQDEIGDLRLKAKSA